MTTWEQRCKQVVSGKARLNLSFAVWSPKHQRKAIKMSQQIRDLKGGSGSCKVYHILSLCDGSSVMSLLCRMMAQESNASYKAVAVEFDPICQRFVQLHFPEAASGWSKDVLDWVDPEFQSGN